MRGLDLAVAGQQEGRERRIGQRRMALMFRVLDKAAAVHSKEHGRAPSRDGSDLARPDLLTVLWRKHQGTPAAVSEADGISSALRRRSLREELCSTSRSVQAAVIDFPGIQGDRAVRHRTVPTVRQVIITAPRSGKNIEAAVWAPAGIRIGAVNLPMPAAVVPIAVAAVALIMAAVVRVTVGAAVATMEDSGSI